MPKLQEEGSPFQAEFDPPSAFGPVIASNLSKKKKVNSLSLQPCDQLRS
jgi:hypothetical protein